MGLAAPLKKIALVATSPAWLPVVIVALTFEWHFLPSEWRLRRKMKAAHRWIGKRALRTTAPGGGTIILDFPTFNWGITRIWWTPDDVLSLAPSPPSTEAEVSDDVENFRWAPFDRWVYSTYLDPDHGRGLLLSVWHSGRSVAAVKQRYPGRTVISTFSGGRDLEAFVNEVKSKRAE